uniref:[Phosphatase 2A protein]-leucine-carboxy methyltransferase n=1 Tax=Rhabditophanes sp. KR3021 TaxID=114890 RepID=A0AC35TVA0_9BILA
MATGIVVLGSGHDYTLIREKEHLPNRLTIGVDLTIIEMVNKSFQVKGENRSSAADLLSIIPPHLRPRLRKSIVCVYSPLAMPTTHLLK